MPADYHHGVRVIEINTGSRPIRTVNTAIIGLIATASDADATLFPLDTPVLLTNPQAAIAQAGVAGTLAKSLAAITAQANAVTIVVRVAEGTDAAHTTTNVIGTVTEAGRYTGMQALLSAQSQLTVKPRILGAPGLDTEAVATALAAVAQKLRGFAYVSANGAATKEAATLYQKNFSQRELMVIWPDFQAWDLTASAPVASNAVAYALGLRAKLDEDVGWHKTLSNIGVNGVIGLSHDVYFDVQNTATDADYLNTNNVTTLVHSNGYRFWGSRTCSDDPLFAFENYTRTAQVLADTMAEAHMWAVDKPITPTLVKDIMEGVNAKLREMKSNGYLIDGSCWYDETINTQATLKEGKLYLDYDYTPVPPLENLLFKQRITDRYLVDFAKAVNT